MPYAHVTRVNPDNAGRDTANTSRHMMCYAVFCELDEQMPYALFTNESAARTFIHGEPVNLFIVPFKITRKQWTQLFATGRVAWADKLSEGG